MPSDGRGEERGESRKARASRFEALPADSCFLSSINQSAGEDIVPLLIVSGPVPVTVPVPFPVRDMCCQYLSGSRL